MNRESLYSLIIDTLCRKERHHLILSGPRSQKLQEIFLANLQAVFQAADFFYFTGDEPSVHSEKKYCVMIIANNFSEEKYKWIKNHLQDPKWRIILLEEFSSDLLKNFFTKISWEEPQENESILLLKKLGQELALFYTIELEENIFSYAYALAKQYIGGSCLFESTYQLIDSACARAKRLGARVTTEHIAETVSCQTDIPVTNLHHNKWMATHLIPALQQKVFGQETAINMIGMTLQSLPLRGEENYPLASFLFVGKSNIGKKKLAITLADYLYGSQKALLEIAPHKEAKHWLELKTTQNQLLKDAILEKPYAIVLFENITDAFNTLQCLDEILMHAYFRQAIIIVTTMVGAEYLSPTGTLARNNIPVMDLMQLVLNENPLVTNKASPQNDLQEKMLIELKLSFSHFALQILQIIPCLPLTNPALEKIMHVKLMQLTKTLEQKFQIELQYAPEVMKYLVHAVDIQQGNCCSIDKVLENSVYQCISHAIFSRTMEQQNKKKLYLSLNDSGQLLKSEFISTRSKEYYV